jgi:hypothetical protein
VTGTIGYSCKNTLLLRCLICCLLLSLTTAAAALDPVNLHVSAGISPNTLIYRFTNEKGFYREEGLELLPIQAGMLPGIQGLVGGSFHVSQILGQAQELQRLAALVPRPRLHLIRFHGVLAPNAKSRSEIIPSPVEQATEPACDHAQAQGAPARMSWARLLKRVFDIDIDHCPNCGGSLKIIAAIEDPPVIVRILTHLGLPTRAPPRAPAQRVDLFQTI